MLEIPESNVIAKQIDKTIKGKTIKAAKANSSPHSAFLSKNTVNTPRKKCGALIKKEAYLGGSIYFCPKCQKDAWTHGCVDTW